MGDYVHRPVMVYGSLDEVEKARTILHRVISGLVEPLYDHHSYPDIPIPSRLANNYALWMIPSSGGKEGGGIQRHWEEIIDEWKMAFMLEGVRADWVELEVGEVRDDGVKETSRDFVEAWRESQDP